jgi:hypothetical protein
MKVKFTDSVIKKVKYGTIVEMINNIHGTPELFVVQGDEGGRFIINPNSDYNFRFIKNEIAEKAFRDKCKELADKYDL